MTRTTRPSTTATSAAVAAAILTVAAAAALTLGARPGAPDRAGWDDPQAAGTHQRGDHLCVDGDIWVVSPTQGRPIPGREHVPGHLWVVGGCNQEDQG